jgi:hypothetical protein
MQPFPSGIVDSTQLLKEHFAFELIDESKHRAWLETMMTEQEVVRALASWSFGGIGMEGPHFYKFTRVIKRLSDNAYVCYNDSMIMNITDDTYRVVNGGRMMHPDSRDRGALTKAIADEGLDYWFCRFPWTIEEVAVQLPPGFDMSKRSTIAPTSSSSYEGENGYSRKVWTKQNYLDSL